jgi:shikimate dehydrogenase
MQMLKEVYQLADLQAWQTATAGIEPPIRLGVFGDPVEHSASPPMHNGALKKMGILAQYCRVHIRLEELEQGLRCLSKARFIGVNLTIPHKTRAVDLVDEITDHARQIGAVNTIAVDGEKLAGFNTDGPGLVRAIRSDFSVDLRDLRVMVLGAGGGAGKSIAVQCALERCERLVLVNRTLEKAQDLLETLRPYFRGTRLAGPSARLDAIPWDLGRMASELEHVDLVINATSVGMKRSDPELLPRSILLPHLMIYDVIYTAGRTKLMIAAEEAGARAASGLSMLLHQGALSFETWFNTEAPIEDMRVALYDHARTATG